MSVNQPCWLCNSEQGSNRESTSNRRTTTREAVRGVNAARRRADENQPQRPEDAPLPNGWEEVQGEFGGTVWRAIQDIGLQTPVRPTMPADEYASYLGRSLPRGSDPRRDRERRRHGDRAEFPAYGTVYTPIPTSRYADRPRRSDAYDDESRRGLQSGSSGRDRNRDQSPTRRERARPEPYRSSGRDRNSDHDNSVAKPI